MALRYVRIVYTFLKRVHFFEFFIHMGINLVPLFIPIGMSWGTYRANVCEALKNLLSPMGKNSVADAR